MKMPILDRLMSFTILLGLGACSGTDEGHRIIHTKDSRIMLDLRYDGDTIVFIDVLRADSTQYVRIGFDEKASTLDYFEVYTPAPERIAVETYFHPNGMLRSIHSRYDDRGHVVGYHPNGGLNFDGWCDRDGHPLATYRHYDPSGVLVRIDTVGEEWLSHPGRPLKQELP